MKTDHTTASVNVYYLIRITTYCVWLSPLIAVPTRTRFFNVFLPSQLVRIFQLFIGKSLDHTVRYVQFSNFKRSHYIQGGNKDIRWQIIGTFLLGF
jgi:hypothetical protein